MGCLKTAGVHEIPTITSVSRPHMLSLAVMTSLMGCLKTAGVHEIPTITSV